MQRVAKGTGSPFWQPSSNTRKGHKSEERKEKAATGGLFFGYFLLAAQKKVTRFRVR